MLLSVDVDHKEKQKNWASNYSTYSIFYQVRYGPYLDLLKILRKRTTMAENTWKNLFFKSLSLHPWRPWSQSKMKAIGHATASRLLIILWNCNIIHALTCPKSWRKQPKRSKILKNNNFSTIWALFPVDLDQKGK